MHQFTIFANQFLSRDVKAFYHTPYLGYRRHNNPDYLNTFKNTYNSFSIPVLLAAQQQLKLVLETDLASIKKYVTVDSMVVCVVPRSKNENCYHTNQQLFKLTVKSVVNFFGWLVDGTDFIKRHTNTRTTHLSEGTPNYNNDGSLPYPGLIKETCSISTAVRGKDILLIDDIYTKTVNVDEDAIQALFDHGARSVLFYAVAKTV